MNSIEKAMDVTAGFEGAGYSNLAGNFDGTFMSFGFLQWNAKTGELYHLIKECVSKMPKTMQVVFGDLHFQFLRTAMASPSSFQQFCRSINNSDGHIIEPWHSYFLSLGNQRQCQLIQQQFAMSYINNAKTLMLIGRMESERAFALCFDICVQDGYGSGEKAIVGLRRSGLAVEKLGEKQFLIHLAIEVANEANPKWRQDVKDRKLCIAEGHGKVHGKEYSSLDITDDKATFS